MQPMLPYVYTAVHCKLWSLILSATFAQSFQTAGAGPCGFRTGPERVEPNRREKNSLDREKKMTETSLVLICA